MKTLLSFVVGSLFCLSIIACGGNNSTTPKSWSQPTLLVDDSNYSLPIHQMAMDSHGNAIIVWEQYDGFNHRIYISEYRNGTWTHPADLAADAISLAGSDASWPHVAMDDHGNAIIVWEQYVGSNNQIYMSEYRNGSWTHPADLATDAISIAGSWAIPMNVAMNNNGDAIIAWMQKNGTINQIYMSEYRNGSWSHPSDLAKDAISIPGTTVWGGEIAMNNLGRAIIAWVQNDGITYQVYFSEYRNGVWSHPTDLETDAISIPRSDVRGVHVAMDDNDNAIISWAQSDGLSNRIYLSEYRNERWTHPSDLAVDPIDVGGSNATVSSVTMDNLGNSIIAWVQPDGLIYQIYLSEYRNGTWTHPTSLANDSFSIPGTDAIDPHTVMDNIGGAILSWAQMVDGTYQIFIRHYQNGIWSEPIDLTTDTSSLPGWNAISSVPAMDRNGNAIITWEQHAGATGHQIYFREFR